MKFIVVKKKYLFFCLIFFIACVACFFVPNISTVAPKFEQIILIDAGHGGIDGGSVGVVTGNTENVLNLEYANTLKAYFEEYGFKVIMTRNDLNGLYSENSSNKKKDDMVKRKEIIQKSNASVVLSVHMNSFPLSSCKGAQVFYKPNDIKSQTLADTIQKSLVDSIDSSRKNSQVGDYFVLNCSNIPSVIVEFGFLSNNDEDVLLSKKDYKNKICYSVFSGVVRYLFDVK